MRNGKLKIILKSDLCTGSGFSYAGSVDTDVEYDKYGFPYIPGKRIKGCMRDAAIMIGWDDEKICKTFGEKGAETNIGIRIGNAVLPDAEKMALEIEEQPKNIKKYLSTQSILNQYTSVRSQTRIDEKTGIAQENTLRFTRVVNHYLPEFMGGDEVVFEANVSFDSGVTETDIKSLALATRNIGLNRTRGLGAVRIEYSGAEMSAERGQCLQVDTIGEWTRIRYCIQNVEPLLMCAESDDESVGYISGTSVLGALATEYLKNGTADDGFFKENFLGEGAIFSNLTPAMRDEKGYVVSYMAPLYIQKMKKSKKLVNILKKDESEAKKIMEEDWQYSPLNGNMYKKLKTEFITENNDIYEPKMDIAYHHRKKNGREADEQLFFFSVLESGQLFAGEILVKDGKDADMIKQLLENANLRFGKSKSAQYGECRLVNLKGTENTSSKDCKAGRAIVRFLSDAVFMDDEGNYTVNNSQVYGKIIEALGVDGVVSCRIYLQTKVLTGYMSVWNLQKEQVPAISAGSAVEVEIPESWREPLPLYIGEKTNEGLGRVSIENIDGITYKLDENNEQSEKTGNLISDTLKKIYVSELTTEKLNEAINTSHIGKGLTSSAIGRLTLMLDEAVGSNRMDVEKQLEDFKKRIDSIKSDETRKKAVEFYNGIEKAFDNETDECLKDGLKNQRMKLGKALLVKMKYANKE